MPWLSCSIPMEMELKYLYSYQDDQPSTIFTQIPYEESDHFEERSVRDKDNHNNSHL